MINSMKQHRVLSTKPRAKMPQFRGYCDQDPGLGAYSQGFISIFSVLIIMSILTLIVIGFTTVTQRAQSRTLDNQLNTQAYYAAESGVNAAISYLNAGGGSKTDCQGVTGSSFFTGYNNGLDSSLGVGYSCVLVSLVNPTLSVSVPVQGLTLTPVTLPLNSSTSQRIKSFQIEWSSTTGLATIPTINTLNSATAWATNNYLGLVRVDLVPNDNSANLNRDALATNSYTFFLYPTTSGATSSFNISNGTNNQGEILYSRCVANSTSCTATINFSSPQAAKFIMRLQSVYSPTSVTIKNGTDVNNSPTSWKDGQAVIDVTGRANDIFRRIQVYKRLTKNGPTAPFAVQSADSVCKVLQASTPNSTTDSAVNTTDDDACRIN